MFTCRSCGESKPVEDFYKKKHNQRKGNKLPGELENQTGSRHQVWAREIIQQ